MLVHDAARPFLPPEIVPRLLEALGEGFDGAVPGLPVADTVKRARDGVVVETLPRDELVAVQTPQAFVAAVLRRGSGRRGLRLRLARRGRRRPREGRPRRRAAAQGDDGGRPAARRGLARRRAGRLASRRGRAPDRDRASTRTRSRTGVPLVLGGVELDHPRGLAGHSDGDVLAHALIDARARRRRARRHRLALPVGRRALPRRLVARAARPRPTPRCGRPAGGSSTPTAC